MRRPLPEAVPAETLERFSLVAGGPFHRVLSRVGLIGADQLPTRSAALVLASLAWLPPALLALAQSLLDGDALALAFFTDATVHTRYLVAVGVMVATERHADGRLVLLTRQFVGSGLVSGEARVGFRAALVEADRRSSSSIAEVVMLAVALLWSTTLVGYLVSLAGATWEGAVVDGQLVFSWAGQAARFLSTPLFLFLVFRWIWRFVVWTTLLLRISRLPLELSPLHPDRSGGLGFLSIYPSIFSGFAFALSCVIAASFLRELHLDLARLSSDAVWYTLATWLAFIVGVFVGPLLVFARPLYTARERALLDYGRLAHRHHVSFHRKWIEGGKSGEELLGSADPSSVSDLNASVAAVWALRLVPVDLSAVIQLLLASGIPLLAVVATQMPLIELAKRILGAIL